MSAIEATTVKCATLVDGTLRVTLDIEPSNAQKAFTLFGSPGRGVAVAALKDGRAAIERADPPAPKPPKTDDQMANWHHLGPLCRAAIQWGSSPDFQAFIGVKDADAAEQHIKTVCRVESRKEFDADESAGRRFKHFIAGPYQKHMQARAA